MSPLIIGWLITIGLIGIYVIMGFQSDCFEDGCVTKFEQLRSSPPNEIGDTLAGLAGALAFLWIIVTVMLQKQELEAQRQELRLTRSESAKMAAALDAQVKILEDEQQQRTRKKLNEENEKLISHVSTFLEQHLSHHWVQPDKVKIFDYLPIKEKASSGRALVSRPGVLIRSFARLLQDVRARKLTPTVPPRFDEFTNWIEEITTSFDELSTSNREELKQLRINYLAGELLLFDMLPQKPINRPEKGL